MDEFLAKCIFGEVNQEVLRLALSLIVLFFVRTYGSHQNNLVKKSFSWNVGFEQNGSLSKSATKHQKNSVKNLHGTSDSNKRGAYHNQQQIKFDLDIFHENHSQHNIRKLYPVHSGHR